MEAVVCEAHGTPTRLSCVTCEQPICPECMVQTKVGFKCREHGLTDKAPVSPREARQAAARANADGDARSSGSTDGQKPGRRARGAARGPFSFFIGMMLAFVAFAVVSVGFGFLFAATGDSTGAAAALPLVAVLLLLAVGTVVLLRRVTR